MIAEPSLYIDHCSARFKVLIRLCREADLPLLEWFGAFTHHRAIIREAYELQQAGEALMILAVLYDFPVGQAWLDFRRQPGAVGPIVWAARVFPTLRGLGIGSELLTTVERLAREKGYRSLEVRVEKSNSRARDFYERNGWQLVRELEESYSYTTPAGHRVLHHLDEWVLSKALDLPGERPTRR